MSSIVAVVTILVVCSLLIAYQIGFVAGKREGFEDGRKKGKHEGSVKAFSVGYDRGRREREPPNKEEDADDDSGGCAAVIVLLIIPIAAVFLRMFTLHKN